jgi:alpha-L-rhamnosidase
MDDAARFDELAAQIRAAFNATFYDSKRGRYLGDEMTAQACALHEGLVEDAERPRVLAALLSMVTAAHEHVGVGMLGARYLMRALAENGHPDVAVRIAAQRSYPGWGHWMEQGATTLWENWEGSGSRNHIMFGDISAWFFATLGGIRPDASMPGFAMVSIAPAFVPELEWAEAEHRSMRGVVRSSWRRAPEGIALDVEVPANGRARVVLPVTGATVVSESGQKVDDATGVESVERTEGRITVQVGSGTYSFELQTP